MQFNEITSQFLVDNYLFGIPLEDQYGNKMKNDLLEHYIKASIQYIQRALQIIIEPIDIVQETHDYYQGDMNSWGFIQFHKRPVISVSEMAMYYGGTKSYEIPQDWMRIYHIPGQMQILPSSGSASSMVLTQGGGYMPLMYGIYQNAPQIWRITYRAGMDDIPEDIIEFIMKRACIGILSVWGDLIIGAGIANQTISLDGLSQSIGTTQSPEFTGAGARMKNYSDDIKVLEKNLRDTYLGINMGII